MSARVPRSGAAQARARLEAVLLEAQSLDGGDLKQRLLWLERAADAADAVHAEDAASNDGKNADDDGKDAGLHLRAALGAIIQWSRGPKDPATLPALDAVVRTLLNRGLLGVTRSLAASYDALVDARVPHRAACAEARDALLEMARALEKGLPPPPSATARFARVRASLVDG